MTQPLIDPQLAAFQNSDPARFLQQQDQVQPEDPAHLDRRKLTEAAIALAAAFLVMRRLVGNDLQKQPPPLHSEDESKRFIKRAWRMRAPFWAQLAVPAIRRSYELGLIENLSQDELEYMAKSYAEDLGEYINETSSQALLQGFHEQLGQKWSESLAWHRSCAAFGLDPIQMRAYVRGPLVESEKDAQFELLPARAKNFIDQAVLTRAERIGGHESWQAMEMGKALAWLAQKNAGTVPDDAQKEWLTAADERVCPQCGPLNRKRVFLHEQFQTPDGNKYWAPGVHPSCRCDLKLIYPELSDDPWVMVQKAEPGDPYDRDRKGRFARVESRAAQVLDRPDPELEELTETLTEAQEVNPFADTQTEVNPFAATSTEVNPFGQAVTQEVNPFTKPETGEVNPFTQAKTEMQQEVNPFVGEVNPFVATPMDQRLILVFVNGKPQLVKPPVGGGKPKEYRPLYLFAHDYEVARSDDPKLDQELVDVTPMFIGKIIDFDHPTGSDGMQNVNEAKPWMYAYGTLFSEAEERYPDFRAFKNDSEVQEDIRRYHHKVKEFADLIPINLDTIANFKLSDDEVYEIAANADLKVPPRYLMTEPDIDRLRGRLVFSTNDDALLHSLSYYLERWHPDWIGGPNGVGHELHRARHKLLHQGVGLHTPNVFIIPTTHKPTLINTQDDSVILQGKYQVYKMELRNGGADTTNRPDNIGGVRLVYLRPVDDYTDQSPHPDEAQAMPHVAWDQQGFMYDPQFGPSPSWDVDEIDDVYGGHHPDEDEI